MGTKPEKNSIDEIEITPEMVEAGAEVLLCAFGGDSAFWPLSPPEMAASVFLAMSALARKAKHP